MIILLKCFLLLSLAFTFNLNAQEQPIKVILDTDMDSDIDDAAALAALHYYANEGKAEILATISCSARPYSTQLIDIINTYYNRPDIPIAKPEQGAPDKQWIVKGEQVSKEFPHDITITNAPTSNRVYREVLSQQEDTSVVIISLGYLNNLSELLKTGPDEFSDLNGMELVRKKVKTYYCMAGRYPADTADRKSKAGNFRPDPEASV
jgi:inosine-uridine nucleoside N-ribohydrolase